MSTQTLTLDIEIPKVASPKEWEAARQRLLVKEKQLTWGYVPAVDSEGRSIWIADAHSQEVIYA